MRAEGYHLKHSGKEIMDDVCIFYWKLWIFFLHYVRLGLGYLFILIKFEQVNCTLFVV